MKRSQAVQKDPTQEDGPWQGHPAVDAFLDQVERLEKIKQADQQNAQGGQPQAGGAGGGGNPMDMIQKMMGGKGGAPPTSASKSPEEKDDDLFKPGSDNELETFAQAVDKAPTAGLPKELQQLLQKLLGGANKGGAPQKAPSAGSPPLDKDMISKMMGSIGSKPSEQLPTKKKKKKKGPNPRLLQALMSRLGGGR
jgi:hypothetical protein